MSNAVTLQGALPDYEVTQELGRGAMGIVYLGRHRALDRKVAIKELPASFAADPGVRERFLTEARVVAALDHPHVVVIHDFVDRDGHLAIVMEHLPNGTVWDQFLNHGLAAPRACGLVLATLAGVHHAHDRGIMHRDIKPENLIFTHDWQLKVTDFGIAQVLTGGETMATAEGAIVGTPAYMSPEQAEGRTCGPPADVYASGAMLYEMLTGSLPFPHATTALDMATARLTDDPVPIATVGPKIPGAVAEVTMHALARSERDRFSSAEEFGVALGQAAADTWGPDWMSESGTAVRGSDAIERASRTTGAGFKSRAVDPDTRETVVDPASAPAQAPTQPAQPTAPPAPRLSVAEMAPINPGTRTHIAGANLHDVDPAEMLNLAEVRAPRSPLPWAVIALVGLVVAALVALTGLGADPQPSIGTAAVVDGAAVRQADEPVEVDLTMPFGLSGVPDGTYNASFLGVPIGNAEMADGEFNPGYLRYSGAGVIELSPADDPDTSFPVRASNSVYPTAPFVVAVMIALGAFASVQSNLKGMRARRIRISPYIGLIISGAILGASVAVLAMLVLQTPASLNAIIAAAAASAVGCLAAGEAFRRWRRRRRLKRVTVATGRR